VVGIFHAVDFGVIAGQILASAWTFSLDYRLYQYRLPHDECHVNYLLFGAMAGN